MHDPHVVAFEIRRPWPRRERHGLYWPTLITVWHVEPGGRDSGEVCRHYTRIPVGNGQWTTQHHHGWRWHVHHWRIQVHPLQALRRWALTRCAWCDGRQRKNDPVNVSHSWDGPRGRWWQGEPGLYHHDCSSVASAWAQCVCKQGVWDEHSSEHGPYGRCAVCNKGRSFGMTDARLARLRLLAEVPRGARDRAVYERVCELARAEQAMTEATP